MAPVVLTGYWEKEEQGILEEPAATNEEEIVHAVIEEYRHLTLYPPINLKAIFEG